MVAQKQLEKVEYFNYLFGLITTDAICAREIISRVAMTKPAFSNELGSNLRKIVMNCYIWSAALLGADTWKLHSEFSKFQHCLLELPWQFWNVMLEKVVKISWTDREKWSFT